MIDSQEEDLKKYGIYQVFYYNKIKCEIIRSIPYSEAKLLINLPEENAIYSHEKYGRWRHCDIVNYIDVQLSTGVKIGYRSVKELCNIAVKTVDMMLIDSEISFKQTNVIIPDDRSRFHFSFPSLDDYTPTDGSLRVINDGKKGYYCEVELTDGRKFHINSFDEVMEKYPLFTRKPGKLSKQYEFSRHSYPDEYYCGGQLIYILYNYLRDQVCFIHFKRIYTGEINTSESRCLEFKINDDFTMRLRQLHWKYRSRKMMIERVYHFCVSQIEVDTEIDSVKFYRLPVAGNLVVDGGKCERIDITWAIEHVRNNLQEKLPELLRMLSGIVSPVCRLICEYAQI